jgi:hypothetical protein
MHACMSCICMYATLNIDTCTSCICIHACHVYAYMHVMYMHVCNPHSVSCTHPDDCRSLAHIQTTNHTHITYMHLSTRRSASYTHPYECVAIPYIQLYKHIMYTCIQENMGAEVERRQVLTNHTYIHAYIHIYRSIWAQR